MTDSGNSIADLVGSPIGCSCFTERAMGHYCRRLSVTADEQANDNVGDDEKSN
jgi:hypothetical protein